MGNAWPRYPFFLGGPSHTEANTCKKINCAVEISDIAMIFARVETDTGSSWPWRTGEYQVAPFFFWLEALYRK